eukprot:5533587-Amphidinium_carterae.1
MVDVRGVARVLEVDFALCLNSLTTAKVKKDERAVNTDTLAHSDWDFSLGDALLMLWPVFTQKVGWVPSDVTCTEGLVEGGFQQRLFPRFAVELWLARRLRLLPL